MSSQTPLAATYYTNWFRNEPTRFIDGEPENCVEIYPHLGGTWNDAPCTEIHNYICEKSLGWVFFMCTSEYKNEKCVFSVHIIVYLFLSNSDYIYQLQWNYCSRCLQEFYLVFICFLIIMILIRVVMNNLMINCFITIVRFLRNINKIINAYLISNMQVTYSVSKDCIQ
jgi:hypothetical protein